MSPKGSLRPRDRAQPRIHGRAPERGRSLRQKSGLFVSPFLPLFPHSLFRMARVAQALKIGRVREQRPVPLVIPNVVHIGGPGTDASSIALLAERLPQKLAGAQLIRPDRQTVPAVPRGGLPPGCLLRSMPGTPAVTGQYGTTWMPAGTQGFACHGLSPPRNRAKQKTPRSTTTAFWLVMGSGV